MSYSKSTMASLSISSISGGAYPPSLPVDLSVHLHEIGRRAKLDREALRPAGRGMDLTDHARRFLRRHRMVAEIGAQLAADLAGVLRFLITFVGHRQPSAPF